MQLFNVGEGLLLLALFAVASYAITVLAMRRYVASKTSFLVADRKVGWVRAAFSIAATWIWAPALFVAAQQGYTNGWVGVFWFTVPNVACLILFAVFAARMRKRHPDGFTLSGYVRDHLSERTHKVYLAALAGLAVCSFAVQLLAGGLIVATLTGLPYTVVTLALVITAVAYSLRSGLGASIVTDYAQMILIGVVGLVVAPWVAVTVGGDTLLDGLKGVEGNVTSLVTGPGAGVFWAFGLSTTIGLLSGPFGDQSFWQRAWAVKEDQVKKAFVAGALIFAVVPLTMSILGFAAAGAGLQIDNVQLTNLEAVVTWLPEWVLVPFLVFILSGLVSTLDSNLCSVASLAGHDLTRPPAPTGSVLHDALHEVQHNNRVVRNARIAMVTLAVLATALANLPGLTIVSLFIFYGTLRASTFVPTVYMLSTRRPVSEAGVFYGVLTALLVGVPISAYGNLTGTVPAVVAGSLAVLALSGGITMTFTRRHRRRLPQLDADRIIPGVLTATHHDHTHKSLPVDELEVRDR